MPRPQELSQRVSWMGTVVFYGEERQQAANLDGLEVLDHLVIEGSLQWTEESQVKAGHLLTLRLTAAETAARKAWRTRSTHIIPRSTEE